MTPATAPPLPAATVLVVRATPAAPIAEIEVLLVRRSHRASFMANAFVFPGGRVDAADADQVDPMQAMRRAAARELSEEVGLSVADLAELVHFAHWITPAAEPKRFDTAFFLWPLGPAAPPVQVDGSEVFDPLWTTPAAALARYAEGTLNLPPPTVCTIEDLAAEVAAARAAGPAGQDPAALLQALLTRCAARRPLPVLPKFCAEPDGALSIVMPWDAQYAELPGVGESAPALATQAAPVARRIRRCQLRPESPRPGRRPKHRRSDRERHRRRRSVDGRAHGKLGRPVPPSGSARYFSWVLQMISWQCAQHFRRCVKMIAVLKVHTANDDAKRCFGESA